MIRKFAVNNRKLFQRHNWQLVRKMSFRYPSVRRDESVKDDYHGVEIVDAYRWLEDPDSEDTKKFVEAQNDLTRPYLESVAYRKDLKEKLTKLWDFPKFYQPFRQGDRYFQFRNMGLQNQNVIYQGDSLENLWKNAKIFFDPNTLSQDGTVSLQGLKFSENGKILAYGLSSAGSDWMEIRFKDVETGNDYSEILKKVKFSTMSWTHDNKGFFYCAYLDQSGKTDGSETDSNKNQKVYYHQLGKDQSEDVAVVAFEDPLLRIAAQVSYCGKYLVVSSRKGVKNNFLYYSDLSSSQITGMLNLQTIVKVLEADYEYITNNGSKFIFRTNRNAPTYKVIVIDFKKPDESKWVTLIADHPKDVLEECKPINNDQMFLVYLRDVKHTMHLHNLESGAKIMDFPLEIGSLTGMSGKRQHTELFFGFTSFLTPSRIFRIDFTKPLKAELIHETKIGDFQASDFVSKQIFYESKDGTKIPMFILHKAGFLQDGSNPCLLYAYGGFSISLTPQFSISRLLFLKHFNGVFGLANIRGGGEYGEKWHDGGNLAVKQNCFDDFQHAAKYLVSEKYTNKSKLVIQGGSNGGLLVGACINQSPELFGTVICHVGVLDMLRFHKFTIGYAWVQEYGGSDDPEQFKCLLKYSPLHNIKIPEDGRQYPATLLLTADHDDRVVPLHSFKFIAELQHRLGAVEHQKNPLMIRIETKAGHGAGKPTTKTIDEIVDVYCFIGKSLGLVYSN